MKKILIFLFVLLLPHLVFASAYDDIANDLMKQIKDKKKTVAVMPFNFGSDPHVGSSIADEMSKALLNKGANIVERSQLSKVIDEQKLNMTGLLDQNSAITVGKGLGASYIVVGSATEFSKQDYVGKGLRIFARIIDVRTYKALAAANGEVSRDDLVSAYKRGKPRAPAEYSSFIEIFGGINKYNITNSYEDHDTNQDIVTENAGFNTGFLFAGRYLKSSKGFFTWGYEFLYEFNKIEDDNSNGTYQYTFYNINLPVLIRIPLWRYIGFLPDFTHLYFGLLVGGQMVKIEYYNVKDDNKDYTYGFGWNIVFHAGLKWAFNENISVNVEYRYRPRRFNYLFSLQDLSSSESSGVVSHIGGHQLMLGFAFAP